MKTYTIAGTEYVVKELTFAQDEVLLEVMAASGLLDIDSLHELPIGELIMKLSAQKLLRKFFAVLIVPKDGEYEEEKLEEMMAVIGKATNPQLEGIYKDFLSSNGAFLKRLRGYMVNLFKLPAKIESWIAENASKFISSSAAETSPTAK